MATLNQAQLIGYVGDEPKSIATRSGRTMISFALATTDREVKRQDGTTIPERTEWHNITAFGRVGDFVRQYVHKGAMLFIQGSIRYRVYDKQDGSKGYVTEIVADNIQWLDRKTLLEHRKKHQHRHHNLHHAITHNKALTTMQCRSKTSK